MRLSIVAVAFYLTVPTISSFGMCSQYTLESVRPHRFVWLRHTNLGLNNAQLFRELEDTLHYTTPSQFLFRRPDLNLLLRLGEPETGESVKEQKQADALSAAFFICSSLLEGEDERVRIYPGETEVRGKTLGLHFGLSRRFTPHPGELKAARLALSLKGRGKTTPPIA